MSHFKELEIALERANQMHGDMKAEEERQRLRIEKEFTLPLRLALAAIVETEALRVFTKVLLTGAEPRIWFRRGEQIAPLFKGIGLIDGAVVLLFLSPYATTSETVCHRGLRDDSVSVGVLMALAARAKNFASAVKPAR
jgi:hypothetical protein